MGTHSVYDLNENSKLIQGMRIKLMCTLTASSCSAPLCLVVSGLDENELLMNECELKESKGILVLKIEGFSMHSSADPLNKSCGHMIFMRNSKSESYSADESRYDFYNTEIFYDFVNGIRKLKFPEWDENTTHLPGMTAISWCDGNISQIENTMSEKVSKTDNDNKITRMKHNAKQTGQEADCDLQNGFKCTKKLKI